MTNRFAVQKLLAEKISTIPKKNKEKFAVDLLRLIEYAHKDNYDNFTF